MIVVGQQFSQNLRALELTAAAITPIATNLEPETRRQNIGLFLGGYFPIQNFKVIDWQDARKEVTKQATESNNKPIFTFCPINRRSKFLF